MPLCLSMAGERWCVIIVPFWSLGGRLRVLQQATPKLFPKYAPSICRIMCKYSTPKLHFIRSVGVIVVPARRFASDLFLARPARRRNLYHLGRFVLESDGGIEPVREWSLWEWKPEKLCSALGFAHF